MYGRAICKMALLPIARYQKDWDEARVTHHKLYAPLIYEVLRKVADGVPTLLTDVENFLPERFETRNPHQEMKEYKDVSASLNHPSGKSFADILLKYHDPKDVNKSIMTGDVGHIRGLICALVNAFGNRIFAPDQDAFFKNFYKFLKRLFNYDGFVAGEKIKRSNGKLCWGQKNAGQHVVAWSTGGFIKKTKMLYCPYCNSETIYEIPKAGNPNDTYKSALDHFLPRSKYPFLGISLYNLVPSCTRCNSSYKHEKDPLCLIATPQNSAEVRNYWPAHPYEVDLYDAFRFEAVKDSGVRDPECCYNGVPVRLQYCQNQISEARKTEDLMEGVFRTTKTYNHLFLHEAIGFMERVGRFINKDTQNLLRELHGYGISLDELLLGFERQKVCFLRERHSKLKCDLLDFARKNSGCSSN